MEIEILDKDFHTGKNQVPVEIISVNKFVFLSVMTLSVYAIWWIYKVWQFFKEKDKLDIIAGARAIFSLFFFYSLLEKIQNFAKSTGYAESYSSAFLFVIYFMLSLVGLLPESWGLITYVGTLSFLLLIPPLKAFNQSIINSGEHKALEHDGFSSGEVAFIVFGIVFWCLFLLGVFMPDDIFAE